MISNFKFKDSQGICINTYKWEPDSSKKIKGIVQISHGMTEKAIRFSNFAEKLAGEGYIVYANDHRGHGLTAASKEDLGYIEDDDGFNCMIRDMHELTEIIKHQHEGMPIILFGHSMGAFLSQGYAQVCGDDIDALVLSGTTGNPPILTRLGILVAKYEVISKGRRNRSKLIKKLSFESYNNKFKPTRTSADWLSTVREEVDKFIEDDYCGFTCTSSFYYDFLRGLINIYKKKNLEKLPKEMPVLVFGGDRDAFGGFGKGIKDLYKIFKTYGLIDVQFKLYKNGRHEMLHEYNKDEVIDDILSWLDQKTLLLNEKKSIK
ncbi:alpha/beta hydrolase [Clostridium polyendosporum]|uniref:Alpha/beta hydrolase n=1 Tax=Clostridium polyendosporum TaxID=69208 RepID=A0A919RYW8_9CLOT|nr:alpha/beta hydrolase [Clostridium polyendosporum]GIM28809.1 alpha/beta hydrolase [Clostridium polyendosporum]